MEELRFAAGEVIYREGDPADRVYVVGSGRVEVLTGGARTPVTLAVLAANDIFGEMGVLAGRPRSATVRALDDVVVHVIDREAFVGAIEHHPEAAVPVMRILLDRLEKTNLRVARTEALAGPAADPDAPAHEAAKGTPFEGRTPASRLCIWPGSERLAEQMTPQGIRVDQVPLRVGRRLRRGETRVEEDPVHLVLEDSAPFQLSRCHFAIEEAGARLVVRDCGSHTGTIVNGRAIGRGREARIEPMRAGENEVVAGNEKSPFRFRIVVERALTNAGGGPQSRPSRSKVPGGAG